MNFPHFRQEPTSIIPKDVRGKWYVQVAPSLMGSALFLNKQQPDGVALNGDQENYHGYYFDTREEAEEAYAAWLLRGCPGMGVTS